MKTYGYARCSTNENLQDIERQTRELKAHGAEIVYHEFEHGDAASKQQQDAMMETAAPGDTIIVTEVSRLSRSTKQLCEIIEKVKEKRLCLQIIGSVTIDCRSGVLDPMTAAFLQMAGVFSELELSMIRARVRSGMQNAKAKGKQIGRPRATVETIPDTFTKYYKLLKDGRITKMDMHKLSGLSRVSIDKYIKLTEAAEAVKE